jgi:hypothetical protein
VGCGSRIPASRMVAFDDIESPVQLLAMKRMLLIEQD